MHIIRNMWSNSCTWAVLKMLHTILPKLYHKPLYTLFTQSSAFSAWIRFHAYKIGSNFQWTQMSREWKSNINTKSSGHVKRLRSLSGQDHKLYLYFMDYVRKLWQIYNSNHNMHFLEVVILSIYISMTLKSKEVEK